MLLFIIHLFLYLALYYLIQALLVLVSEFVHYACVSGKWYIFIICPQGSSRHAQHSTLGFQFTLLQVFLHHKQIFRLLLKISVKENNWRVCRLIFHRPTLRRGSQKILMQTNVACAPKSKCEFCRDHHLTFLCSSLFTKRSVFKKEGEVWLKKITNNYFRTITQGLLSSHRLRPWFTLYGWLVPSCLSVYYYISTKKARSRGERGTRTIQVEVTGNELGFTVGVAPSSRFCFLSCCFYLWSS